MGKIEKTDNINVGQNVGAGILMYCWWNILGESVW